jgi:hypothetical protein
MENRRKPPRKIKHCTIEGCENRLIARGLCHKHYKRWQISGEPNALKKDYPCKVPNCTNKHSCRGLCRKHFNEYRRKTGYYSLQEKKPSARFVSSVHYAKTRNLEWTIEKEDYIRLTELDCHYCNEPVRSSKVGLDRKKNEEGYTLENVVPCCPECNQIKSNIFTYEEFLELAKTELFKQVSKRLQRKKEEFYKRKIKDPTFDLTLAEDN